MAVLAVQTRALDMGGVVKVQKIAAVNSWLQRSLYNCVAKARARLFLERLKLVTPTNAPARRRGISAALGMVIGQQANREAAHDYRPLTTHKMVRGSRSNITDISAGRSHLPFHPVIYNK